MDGNYILDESVWLSLLRNLANSQQHKGRQIPFITCSVIYPSIGGVVLFVQGFERNRGSEPGLYIFCIYNELLKNFDDAWLIKPNA